MAVRPVARLLAALLFAAWCGHAAARELPRTVLALQVDGDELAIRFSNLHQMAEMPLNHLGLVVVHHDIRKGLPDPETLPHVRGVVTWFTGDDVFDDPGAYLDWLDRMMKAGKHVAVLGLTGAERSRGGQLTPLARINRTFARLGVRFTREMSGLSYEGKATEIDPELCAFEYRMPRVVPGFERIEATAPDVRTHLAVTHARTGKPSHLIVTSPRGAYAAQGFFATVDSEMPKRQWFVNPFEFFRIAFATDGLPKADTTTLSGRRIYYSHVDGDGWRNLSAVEAYAKPKPALSIDVLRLAAIEPFPDLPVSIAPIAADLDPDWYGEETLIESARRILALPQVEAASHTYSHPFDWMFFKDWTAEKEAPFLPFYPPRAQTEKGGIASWLRGKGAARSSSWSASESAGEENAKDGERAKLTKYKVPRAYALKPYSLGLEVQGAADYINRLLPPGKRVEVLQWSGNTHPDAATLAATREAGLANINGGDARFDAEYPSYGWVSPIGRAAGRERQIYASASNENTYTAQWSDRFFGFQHLESTLRNTESPIRIKPINIYYHTYSADKTASLNALLRMLAFARGQEIAPIAASRFARIAEGFYAARFAALGPGRWRIEGRGALQTIRFDRAAAKGVDFARSIGVVGERQHQGSLYVALDEAHPAPVVALHGLDRTDRPQPASRPYLIEGRWRVYGVTGDGGDLSFLTQGFGAGAMTWRVPAAGRYRIDMARAGAVLESVEAVVGEDGVLRFTLGAGAIEPARLRIRRLG